MTLNLSILAVVAIYLAVVLSKSLPRHPKGLANLFFAEMWERFSYYGMRALLVLYMTKGLLYPDKAAAGVYAAYGALVYATPLLGGILADRLLGNRRAVLLGGSLMALGHFVLAIEHPVAFYSALALLILGNGFFKPNMSSLVGSLYEADDPRRDSGFTLFYMGVNTGALAAPLICGYIGETFGWHFGFGLAGVGMVVGILVFHTGARQFGERGLAPDEEGLKRRNLHLIVPLLALACVPLVALLVKHNSVMEFLVPAVAGSGLLYMVYTALRCEPTERDRLLALIGFFAFNVLFWAFFEQAGSSLTLFTDRNVERHFAGQEIPASVFQSVNPIFIVLFGPVFASLWVKLNRVNLNPRTPVKFSLALMQLGLGFGILVWGAKSASAEGMVPMGFLLGAYLFQTTGELCLSPVGLSMVTKLAPKRIVAFSIGFWYLATSVAHHLAGAIAKMTDTGLDPKTLTALQTLPVYAHVFGTIASVSFLAALVLLGISPILRRLMHGVH